MLLPTTFTIPRVKEPCSFAFLIADESIIYLNTEEWQKSNKLKDEEFLEQINIASSQIDEKIGKLLNPDKFKVELGFQIIDTKFNKIVANDSLLKIITENEMNVSKNFDLTKPINERGVKEKLYYKKVCAKLFWRIIFFTKYQNLKIS